MSLLLLVSTCRKKKSGGGNAPADPVSMFEIHNILDIAHDKFFDCAKITNGDVPKTLRMTMDWMLADDTVSTAEVFDSSYLRIVMKSGLMTAYTLIETDDSGKSVFRGATSSRAVKLSASSMAGMGMMSSKPGSKRIENKNVLFYSSGYTEFKYKSIGLIERLAKRFTDNDNAFKVTIIKDGLCTAEKIKSFGDYGLVIMDTHGLPDGFLIGTEINLKPVPKTEEEMNKAIINQAWQEMLDLLLTGNVGVAGNAAINTKKPDWYNSLLP